MSTLITGMISTSDGLAITSTVELSRSGTGATESRRSYYSPAAAYKASQPSHIGVDIGHEGRQVGEVKYLKLCGLGLYGVLEIDDDAVDLLPFPMYLSSELEGVNERSVYSDITLNAVGIVPASAVIAKQQALVVAGDIDTAHLYHHNPNRQLLREAAAYCRERRYKGTQPHRIAGAQEAFEPRSRPVTDWADRAATAPVSNSGRFRTINGQRVEIFHSAPVGQILAVY